MKDSHSRNPAEVPFFGPEAAFAYFFRDPLPAWPPCWDCRKGGREEGSRMSKRGTRSWNYNLWWAGLGLLILFALIVRISVAMHPYSGFNKPPMYGDYEAQRHWMEVTVNLPPSDWYRNTTDNDLLYWGLDYPPLSAYWAWGLGKFARAYVDPRLVALHTSRGFESKETKLFMRWTVWVADLLFLLPASVVVASVFYRRYRAASRMLVAFALMMQPALLLADHGHFQYNGVCVGLALYAVAAVLYGRHCFAALLFCCSFLFKQTGLYFALPMFCMMLGTAFWPRRELLALSGGSRRQQLRRALREEQEQEQEQPERDGGEESAAADPDAGRAGEYSSASDGQNSSAEEAVSATRAAHAGTAARRGTAQRSASAAREQAAQTDAVSMPGFVREPSASGSESGSPQTPAPSPEELPPLQQAFAPWFCVRRVSFLGLVVAATTALAFFPLVRGTDDPVAAARQVLHRMFPIARGIFEDKVANFWCVSSVVFKWKERFSVTELAAFSTAGTLLASLPSCVDLFLRPTPKRFVYCLSSVAFAFFLFSFQVHEKSILFAMFPLSLLVLYHPKLVSVVSIAATLSMYPLMSRERNVVSYVLLQFFALKFFSMDTFRRNQVYLPFSHWPWHPQPQRIPGFLRASLRQDLPRVVEKLSVFGSFVVQVYVWCAQPNPRYPHASELLIACYCFAHFAFAWAFLVYFQLVALPSQSDDAVASPPAVVKRTKPD